MFTRSSYDAQIMHAHKSLGRDKVSNRTRVLPQSIDLRTARGRRFRFLIAEYSAELGGELSEADRALITQRAALQLQAETMQGQIVAGTLIDCGDLIRISSEQRRIAGVFKARAAKNKPADGANDLQAYLAARHGADRAAGPADEAEAVNDEVAETS